MLILSRYIENFDEAEFISDYAKKHKVTKTEARKRIISEEPKEKYFQEHIIKAIRREFPEALVIKLTLSMYSQAGIPDIMVIHNGRYVGIEVKRPIGSRVSELQRRCMDAIHKAGGTAGVCRWPEEAIALIHSSEER